ncbi:L-arabinose transport system permease protein AraQ [compost metagenome]|jgi:multiple sugar transport system permease protein|uniref:carbohydrate ABC transporter permease n=1 Tax=Paenibacillus sp. J53TS2 TaxID=2807197 RepID=UPI000F9DC1CD|nr:carbohydrate ABC transporter permease [Paenibacillus sp. J53TS2]GIP49113.1 sugar ABC transporter ATP-binding protein [Paenibacillus sp. J53TS2]
MTLQRKFMKWILTIVFAALAVCMILPFLWMTSSSFKLQSQMFQTPIDWIPNTFHFDSYLEVWAGKYPFGLYYWNSIKITAISVLGTIATSALAGFAFAKLDFRGKEVMFLLYLSTMIIPTQILLVPRFILFDKLHLVDSHWAIILPGMFSVLGTFIMRQFFSTLPNEILEAAKVDGAGVFRTFWQVSLPLTKPALVSLLILSFTWHWNEYEGPLIFLRTNELYTLPLALTNFVDENTTNYTAIMAASVSALLPLILLVAFFQRWFVEGIASSAVKG